MIKAKDQHGRALEFSVFGRYEDDIEIDEIYYLDETLGEVDDETVDYVLNAYSTEIYEEWQENMIARAEDWNDYDR